MYLLFFSPLLTIRDMVRKTRLRSFTKKLLLIAFALTFIVRIASAQEDDIVWSTSSVDGADYLQVSSNDSLIVVNHYHLMYLHNFRTGKFINSFSNIQQPHFTKDSKYIIGCWMNFPIMLDLTTWKTIPVDSSAHVISSIDISEDGTKFAAAYSNAMGIGIWDIATGKLIKEYMFDNEIGSYDYGALYSIYFIKNDKYVLFSYYKAKKALRPYDPPTITGFIRRTKLDDFSKDLDKDFSYGPFNISNDKSKIFSGSYDDVKIWKAEDISNDTTIAYSYDFLDAMDITHNNKFLATGNRIWDISKKSVYYTYPFQITTGFKFSHDSKYAVGLDGGFLMLLRTPDLTNIRDKKEIKAKVYPTPTKEIFNLQFTLEAPGITNIYLNDIKGNKVKIIENKFLEQGDYSYQVNCRDIPPGFYFLNIESGSFSFTEKLIVNK